MKLGWLGLLLVVTTAGCATVSPRRAFAPQPALAEHSEPTKDGEAVPKRPRVPRWVAPPPAYGNRVVCNEVVPQPDDG